MDESEINRDLLATFVWIQRRKRPSLETFYREIFKPKTPAVLEGASRIISGERYAANKRASV